MEVLRQRASVAGAWRVYTFLGDGENPSAALTCGELDLRARALASRLQARGLAGERVLLLYPPGLDYVVAFWGCLYAGAVAVPAYPPSANRGHARVKAMAADAGARAALITGSLWRRLGRRLAASDLGVAEWIVTDDLDPGEAAQWQDPGVTAGSLAFLQYTSGSTSTPKGVMVHHGNLLENERSIRLAFGQSDASVIVGWLPLYHDMGLIGNVLQPLLIGASCILMPPLAFLERPLRWLSAISRYRATTSGGPNFAYELCVRKISREDREGLDLSCWSSAFNGAEPVRGETLDRFSAAFAPCGFRRQALYPCYGLAEATLFVSGGAPGAAPVVRHVAASALERHRVAAMDAAHPEARQLVGCGHAWGGAEIRIVEPEAARECPAGGVGEIWVAGPSVAGGYWNRPQESERTFRAKLAGVADRVFLRTGDLGFLLGGELFVTGRLKDLIIIRGRNHYPQDLELTAQRSHSALRPRGGAAFSVEADGEERLVVVHELERHREGEAETAGGAVRRALAEDHDVQAHEVVLVAAGGVALTSSGKVRRQACRDDYLAGRLPVVWRSGDGGEGAGVASAPALDAKGLLAVEPALRRDRLAADLRQRAARVLRMPAASLNEAGPLIAAGLDSLAATELRGELEGAFGAPVSLSGLLAGASLNELALELLGWLERGAGALSEEAADEAKDAETAATPLPGGRPFPFSHGQKALWFLDRLAPGNAVYNIAAAAQVQGEVDEAALRRALAGVVTRHAELRVVFAEPDGEPVQTVEAASAAELLAVDGTGWSDAELRAGLADVAYRPFDLARGPLLRLALFRRGGQGSIVALAVHHLVADFQSLAVLLRDLGDGYLGREVAPPPRRGYHDFVTWQEQLLAGPRGERLWAYWQQRLSGLRELELPVDRTRPAVQTYRGASRLLRLAPELSAALCTLAREAECTVFVVLLAAFQTLLYRATGQRDVVVGSPASGRFRRELQDVVGYFVNPLPLRSDLSGDPAFGELLAQVRSRVLEGLEHQAFPFTLMAERLQPLRDPARPPLFQVLFAFQGPDPPGLRGMSAFALGEEGFRLELGGLELTSLHLPDPREPFDLTLAAAASGDGFSLSLRYNRDLFDAVTVERMAGHLATLLRVVAADPESRAGALPLLAVAERFQLTVEWNAEVLPIGGETLLHHAFEAQARQTPEREAVVWGGESVTYSGLDERASALARWLVAAGVGPEVRVGVCLARTPDLVATLLAVLKAGGAFVPLDAAYPASRIGFMLRDAGVAVVVSDRRSAAALPADDATARLLLDDGPVLAGASGRPAGQPDPVNLAYVIYTSGSTGRPKGVAIEHRSATALLAWAGETFRPAEVAAVLASTSICFDLSIFELFVPLSRGGTVILAGNVLELAALPARHQVSLINTVPSAMAELLRNGGLPASVLTVNLAGEPLARALVDAVLRQPAVERVLNLYGPSEDTTYSTWTLAGPGKGGAPTIGRPIANGRAYLLDERLEPLPIGIVGELLLGGPGLARGYLGRPDLTAERFIPDPFSADPGGRLYRTGDLARFRSDGELDFLGRADLQVKIRGFRIEIGDIEAALRSCPQVADAAVAAHRDPQGDLSLVAYWVRAEGRGAPAAELGELLRRQLPAYMVPSLWVELAALPLTPNGKLDRLALPAPERSTAVAPQRDVRTQAVAELLRELWAELLGRYPEPDESFFDLGGHSLAAMRLVSRVHSAFGVDLGPAAVLETPTLAGLAARIEAALGGARPAEPGLVRMPRTAELPPSFAQQRLWFLDQMRPGCTAYSMPAVLHLAGALCAPALAWSVAGIVGRHEGLRTVFPVREGRPCQVVLAPSSYSFPTVDLGSLDPARRAAEALRLATAEASYPFDLAGGPLLRCRLLRLGAEEHELLLNFHHIVFDGWSMEIFARELGAFYSAALTAVLPTLPELPVQYADYALWQRACLAGEARAERLGFWKERLAGAPPLELPTDLPRPAAGSLRGAAETVVIAPDLAAALRGLARAQAVTPFMVFLTSFLVLFSRYSGQDDVCVGSPVAGRTREELEELIGFFVNMVVLRTDLGGDPAFGEALGRVRRTALAAYVHQDLPFELLVEELQPERGLGRQPFFAVVVAQSPALPEPHLAGLRATPVEIATRHARFDLTALVRESAGGFTLTLEYSTDLFTRLTLRRFLHQVESLLAAAAAQPARRLSELSLLDRPERHQVLVEWNDSAAEVTDGRCVHELFAAQARRHPARLAVEQGERRLTYGELAVQADRLALRLRALGVGPQVRVGLCVERSPELLVGALAVLKTGGAFVALDPGSPAERLAYALRDSAAAVLLAREPQSLAAMAGVVALPLDAGGPAPAPAGWEEARRADLDDTAYVIYTSGSTGRPKGVEISHRSLANLVAWHRRTYAVTAEDRASLLAGTGFDASVWEVWPYLAAGASLHVPATEVLAVPAELWRWLAARRVTMSFLPTPLLEAALGEDLPPLTLRAALTGGDRLHRLHRHLPQALFNHYGPTESTVVTTCARVTAGSVGEPSIGRPIDNTRAYVLDRHLRPLPAGATGELCVAGAGLARGYLDRPELTAELLVPDPFGGQPGERMYRTGDLVRLRPDGLLDFIARRDHQVKIRGHRIELGEVESALGDHPGVREAAVTVIDVAGSRELAAHVVLHAGWEVAASDWQPFLRSRLPEYMVPRRIVPLSALPLTANGKVDRRALASISAAAAAEGTAAGPRNAVEAVLAEIWGDLLGLERVDVFTSFFELGGHSLLIGRLLARVREVFGVELPVRSLFESPTVAELAVSVVQHLVEQEGGAIGQELAAMGIAEDGAQGAREALLG
ncbi:MAG TPA: amino acid adenylation domain-containing protein [Thermoanaerobaculia bacterium]|nr:amino acid adenylation domain-containing protein [Thermoanaerobaculia bacterium]